MENTNCHIIALMEQRIQRRKFGLLCTDDSSNYDFVYSYLHRLACKDIDMSCYGETWKPCRATREGILIICNIQVQLDYTVNVSTGEHTFYISSLIGATLPLVYSFTYSSIQWTLVSIDTVTGTLVLAPTSTTSGEEVLNVTVIVTDERDCQAQDTVTLTYLGGCTDPEAINYNPAATFDDGTCYYDPLTISVTYTCNPDTTGTVSVTPSGGLPPYTIIGTPNGAIVPNGSPYGAYAIDSLGNVSPLQNGTIVCPFDCGPVTILPNLSYTCITDEFGFNTGAATLHINPSGGTPPYVITGATDGQAVNHLDSINVTVTDANGCSSGVTNIVIDCVPFVPPLEIDCEDIHFNFSTLFTAEKLTALGEPDPGVKFTIQTALSGLTPGVVFVDHDISIKNLDSPNSCVDCLTLITTTPCVQCNKLNQALPGTFVIESDYSPSNYGGENYNLLVEIIIRFNTLGGPCEFAYSHTYSGTLDSNYSNLYPALDNHTQIY